MIQDRLFSKVWLLILIFCHTSIAAAENELTELEKAAGWLLLFDGSTTQGWMTPAGRPLPSRHVQEGCLNPHPCDYMLVHERPWENFELSLEFKISPQCNSGVFVRTFPLTPRPSKDIGFNGIEIAIDDTTTHGFHDTGAIYDLVPPAKNAMHRAGEWNQLTVRCDDQQIDVVLNGQAVTRMNLDEWTLPNRRPDGSEHKFDVAYRNHPRHGYIGLQDHGGDCWYRNIKLMPLQGNQLREKESNETPSQILFTTQGKTARINLNGSGLSYFDFSIPNQATWQPSEVFPDEQRIVFLSMEPRRDGPGKPFDEYYTQTPTHLWIHDLITGDLQELCVQNRMAPFVTPALLLGNERMLIQVVRDRVCQLYNVCLDGSDPREFTRAGEGLPYGLSLSPDGRRVAFHLASPTGYQVWTSDLEGNGRQLIAADPEHLYFGTAWSPNGEWILYADCRYRDDPGHDWADVCIGKADGSEHKVLTEDQVMWFAATYGGLDTRGGGSNVPSWTPDGKILFPRRHAGSKVAWEYQANRTDVDHFNREFKPELARGGTEICRLDPDTGKCEILARNAPGTWDFRAVASPDGKHIAFCRAITGKVPELFVMDPDGKQVRKLSSGWNGQGADHPKWLAPTGSSRPRGNFD